MIQLKNKLGKYDDTYDDTLDVFAVHCCGGIWGAIATGLFADGAVNSVVNANGAKNGLLIAGGDSTLMGAQLLSIAAAVGLGVVVTTVIALGLKAAKLLRVTEKEEEVGLDLTQHDEAGYVQGDGPGQRDGVFGH